jgi:hypothetical protein
LDIKNNNNNNNGGGGGGGHTVRHNNKIGIEFLTFLLPERVNV